MKSKPCTRGYIPVFLVLLAIAACDTFREKDVVIPKIEPFDYYTTGNGSVLIDLTRLAFGMTAIRGLAIVNQPTRGTIEPVDDLLFRYDPDPAFIKGTDKIVFAFMSADGIHSNHTVTIHAVENINFFPCGAIPVHDRVKISGGSIATIHPLQNDRVCRVETGTVTITLRSEPEHGQATVDGQSIVYTPGADFGGYDEFIYALSRAGSDNVVYGLVSLANYATVTVTEPPGYYISQSFFLSKETGFIFAGNGIHKTTDGGTHWNEIWEHPWEEMSYCYDLFFLDGDHGYGAFGANGLLSTTDGWETWHTTEFDGRVVATFFTSLDVGFVAVETGEAQTPSVSILKTDNGGATWKQVIPPGPVPGWEVVRILFADANTGYIRFPDRIGFTSDGGENWRTIIDDVVVFDLCATPENGLLAVLYEDQGEAAYTWNNGGSWTDVPNAIAHPYHVRFSPSGKVGFAVMRGRGAPLEEIPGPAPVSVARTVDGGLTWTPLLSEQPVFGRPHNLHTPSDDVLYIQFSDWMIKYSTE